MPTHTWVLLEEFEDARVRRELLGGRLEQSLHELVPRAPAGARSRILRLRRDIHNNRAAASSGTQMPCLPDGVVTLLDAWVAAKAIEDQLGTDAAAIFGEERARSREALARVGQDDLFLQGIQLSGHSLYRDVVDFSAAVTESRPLTRRHRHTERTLASFASRVALKPSPFATFAVIGAQPWRPSLDGETHQPVRRAQINLGLLDWMVHELGHLDGAEHCMVLRLNDTARVEGDRISFFTRGAPGSDAQFGGETFASIPLSRPVAALLEALEDTRPVEADVVAQLCSAGASPAVVQGFIDKLVAAGLCVRDLQVEDHAPARASQIAWALASAPVGSAAQAAAGVFARLHDVEARFPQADIQERAVLLGMVADEVGRFGILCGNPGASVEFARSQVFEDLGSRAPARSWNAEVIDASRPAFTVFQELLPLLDDTVFERFGMATWFRHRYGTVAPIPVLDVYRDFSALTSAEKTAVMQGTDDPLCRQLRAERKELLRGIADRLDRDPHVDAIELDLDWMRARAARVPIDARSRTEVAYRLQLCDDLNPGLVVLNGATTGRGVYYSRFCDLLEPDDGGWSLSEAVREDIDRSWPDQADLVAVLGMNVNLHPRLAPTEILYPGALPREGCAPARPLAAVSVRCRPGRPLLELTGAQDGATLDLVPHNFLFPAAAPMLYRFLCTFAPTWTYRRGLWDRIARNPIAADRRYFPRLVLEDLVLERRTWRVPARELAALPDLDDVRSLLAARSWHTTTGLPVESFFRVDTSDLTGLVEHDWIALTRAWAIEARSARLRKPHYLDFRSPVLLDILLRQSRSMPESTVVFQECLPATTSYNAGRPDDHGLAAAEELIVQFRTYGNVR